MKCPSEVELNEFAEDRLESRRRWEIQEHLEQCTRCSGDLEGLDWITGCLGAIDTADESANTEHPADADLAALAEGKVSPDLKAELLSHLSVCAECARVFGTLPRKAGKLTISRSFYGFAAAAVLMIAIGVAAFTGQFTLPSQGARTTVATDLGAAGKDAHTSNPATSEEKQSTPVPPPTVIAQEPTPEPEAAAGVSKPAGAALAMKAASPHHARFERHSVSSRRVRPDSLDNTRIAMAELSPLPKTVSDMPRAPEPAAAAEGSRYDAVKSAPAVVVPSPAKPFATMAIGGNGVSGASATRAPGAGAPAAAAAQTQRAETKSQMIQQSPQPQTASRKKAAAKSAAKRLVSDDAKPKQELRPTGASADNSGKALVKSLAANGAGGSRSSDSGQGHSDSSKTTAGHAPTDFGQSPPGSHDA
jgi:hypothetical protein